jgi:hypothetical protein
VTVNTWPIYHHKRESIDAHLTTVFAALAVTHWIEHQTGWSIKKFVRTARRYRTVRIKAGIQILTATDPLPDDLSEPLTKISSWIEHKIEPSRVVLLMLLPFGVCMARFRTRPSRTDGLLIPGTRVPTQAGQRCLAMAESERELHPETSARSVRTAIRQ